MKNKFRSIALLALALALVCPPVRAEENLDLDFSQQTPGNAAFRSFLVPGWGQYFNGQRAKGSSLLFVTAASLTGTLILRSKSQHTLTDYHNKGVPNDPLYDSYKKQYQESVLLEGATIGLWVFSVVDAYIQARVIPASKGNLPGKHASIIVTPNGVATTWRFGGDDQ